LLHYIFQSLSYNNINISAKIVNSNTHISITTILGLIPLATGFNINFFTLFSEFDANIYIGGDNVIFWGPLAWTVIYGLFIATFLTLIVVPILFYLSMKLKIWFRSKTTPKIALREG